MMRNNRFWVAIAIFAFLSTNLFAQEYYMQNREKVETVAKDAAEKRAKDDQEKLDIYKNAIEKAFEEYWKTPEVKTGLEIDSLANIANKVKTLRERKQALEASLETQRQTANAASEAKKEKEAIWERLIHFEGVAYRQRNDSAKIAGELKDLNNYLAKVESFKLNKKKREDKAKVFAKKIDDFCKKCSEKSLLDSVFFSDGNQLIRQYSGNDQKIHENINKIKGYIGLSQAVQNADVQISGKYNARKNTDAIKQIENTVTALQGLKVSLSQNQRNEYQDRQNLLRNHENVKNSLTEFLDFIQNKYVMINNDEEKKETIDLIRKHLSEDDKWKNLKHECEKYEKLKAALEKFENLEGSIGGGENGLRNYVNGIKRNI